MGTSHTRGTSQEQIPLVRSESEMSAADEERRRQVRFESVPTDESDDDEERLSPPPSPPRRFRRRRNGEIPNGVNVLQNVWIFLFVVVVFAGALLIGWRANVREGRFVHEHNDNGITETEAMPKSFLTKDVFKVHYDPTAGLHPYNPFDVQEADWYGAVFVPPPIQHEYGSDGTEEAPLGYLHQPHIVNDTLVFVSEGDMYLTKVGNNAAMKLTTTVGNVLTPMLNPVYPLIAYTATYTGHREVYLYDLRPSHRRTPALRLTFWDSSSGVSHIVGWKDSGQTLVFSAPSNEIGFPDTRLYQLRLATKVPRKKSQWPVEVLQIEPVPLSQAIDGVYNEDCLYFTRFSQSSNTIRYVGGTVESLWAHCENKGKAVPITTHYPGTDKSPQILNYGISKFLLFLSDRNDDGTPTTMNLWAMLLPTKEDLYSDDPQFQDPIRLTQVSCEYNGMSLIEYSLDVSTGNVVLRIGADLHILPARTIQAKIDRSRRLKQKKKQGKDEQNKNNEEKQGVSAIRRLPIMVYSDFSERLERIIPAIVPDKMTSVDVYGTPFGQTSVLLNIRGQVFVSPVVPDVEGLKPYEGAGMNLPARTYRVAPGSTTGGMLRILTASNVPLWPEVDKSVRRLALLLATDPLSETAEHAFYLVETHSGSLPSFVDVTDVPAPFLGGHIDGGSVADGGLGSIRPESVTISSCGRRLAWTDTDGRICVMTLPLYQNMTKSSHGKYVVLPQKNELGEPMVGDEVDLSFSPGGRYLAVTHSARNQFSIISIVDCGDPSQERPLETADIRLGRIVQATPDRFNSRDVYWGKNALDYSPKSLPAIRNKLSGIADDPTMSTTLYFLSDRDLMTDVSSPWGTRGPSPHFPSKWSVYALPLADLVESDPSSVAFSGGGVAELWADGAIELEEKLSIMEQTVTDAPQSERTTRRYLADVLSDKESGAPDVKADAPETTEAPSSSPLKTLDIKSPFPADVEIDFGSVGESFLRRAYRLANIPAGNYATIGCQLLDDPSFVLVERTPDKKLALKVFIAKEYPSDELKAVPIEFQGKELMVFGLSTTKQHFYVVYSGVMKVVANTGAGLLALISDKEFKTNLVDTEGLSLSVWPSHEYQQMYSDAWRMLRDYFYDPKMTGIDWPEVHARYAHLVKRCTKREELDDVLQQMASELSALHVFVYGGEYSDPTHGSLLMKSLNEIGSLGATFERSAQWKGYVVKSIPERDPDFNLINSKAVFSPLSGQTLRLSGQRGLEVGDVIVGINGESVMRVPDMNMLLRGMVGRSVRLDVLRLASNKTMRSIVETSESIDIEPEPVITVPISGAAAADLRYDAFEWKTRQQARDLAHERGFSVGYVHLRAMSTANENDFVRGFYPDYDKQAFIVDVRHNHGGNIDSWLLDVLQRKAWMYWQSRTKNITTGGLGWDEQMAFRGHLVVLMDEKTSSDGEGFSRGVSELGLGKLVGMRTWGGGIWLASDNHLVDGGIASAPEIGTYNDNFGWGLGIEQMGVRPDVEVDNNPREAYSGRDLQLERAIDVLAKWLEDEPIAYPKSPGPKRDMSLSERANGCSAN